MKFNSKLLIHDSFEVLIFFKGVYAVLETVAAVLVFLVKPDAVVNFIYRITANELRFDPHDRIANYLVNFAHSYSVQGQLFGVLYLLSHGLIKIFLVVNLWRRKLWAYPVAIVVFVLFVIYQMYIYFLNHSPEMLLFTLLDLVVIVLTYLEYQQIKKSNSFKSTR